MNHANAIAENLQRQGASNEYIIGYLTSIIETIKRMRPEKDELLYEMLDFHVEATTTYTSTKDGLRRLVPNF